MSDPRISIVVPTLNEELALPATLAALQPLRAIDCEVIVADGGSVDATIGHAEAGADLVLSARRGRAAQMNAGAGAAKGDTLLFLHADTLLPPGAAEALLGAIQSHAWGRFDVQVTGRHFLLRVVALAMNWRSRSSGIATGDQAMFVRRAAYDAVGGFPEIMLMEDVAMSARLRRAFGRPACLRLKVLTSGRRWERHGVVRTVLKMWCLRLAYALGVSPEVLGRYYH